MNSGEKKMKDKWWYGQLRIIQYNLQMKDTPKMDPDRIAAETKEMGADTVVINVADSVVWYQTKEKYQKINPYLPKGRDLLKELIDAFHKNGIRVLGRGAFMGFEEETYYQHPDWVKRTQDGSPVMLGNERPGEWYRLYAPCPNSDFCFDSGYRVAREAFEKYELDGAFWLTGSVTGGSCWCERCRMLYKKLYGKEMPENAEELDPLWDKQIRRKRQIKAMESILHLRPDMPYLHYYWPFDLDIGVGFTIPADHIDEIAEQGNTLCTEAQDVLSMGVKALPDWNTPALRMKMGRTVEDNPPPVGIIHACPGMDWRHACMPEAEFLYWAAQIPANGGSFWTTFTGFADTIPDKRMLHTVKKLNHMIRLTQEDMTGAKSDCQVLLLSDGGVGVKGWAEALMCAHIDFDMLAHYQLKEGKLDPYPCVIVPKGYPYSEKAARLLADYCEKGGGLIIEGTSGTELEQVKHLLGTEEEITSSEEMEAAYLRLEEGADVFKDKIGECELVPLRGKIALTRAKEGTEVLATWVPPFSKAATAGFPPERATLPKEKTDIPLVSTSCYGNGKVLFVGYEAGRMIEEYALKDMFSMIEACAEYMLGDRKELFVQAPGRVMLSVFKKGKTKLIHLVNGIGQRPLMETVPCAGIVLELPTQGRQITDVKAVISGQQVQWEVKENRLRVTLPWLEVWEMIRLTME